MNFLKKMEIKAKIGKEKKVLREKERKEKEDQLKKKGERWTSAAKLAALSRDPENLKKLSLNAYL